MVVGCSEEENVPCGPSNRESAVGMESSCCSPCHWSKCCLRGKKRERGERSQLNIGWSEPDNGRL